MKIYKIRAVDDRFESLVLRHKENWTKLSQFIDHNQPTELWTTFKVRRYSKPKRGRKKALPSDFPFMAPLNVFSERAVKALGEILTNNGRLLPFENHEVNFFLFLPSRVLDVLDESRSKIWRLDTGRIVTVNEFVFKSDALFDAPIFEIPQLPGKQTFVTEKFVAKVRASDLQGFVFTELPLE